MGLEEGLAKGTETGRQMGLEAGMERGREEGRREAAKNFRAMGLPVDQIAAATGLDPEVIDAL
jgi:predicted transposase YdaD